MTNTELNKRAHELLGIRWHECIGFKSYDGEISFEQLCSCGYHTPHDLFFMQHIDAKNKDFTSPAGRIELLEIMETHPKGRLFFASLIYAGNYEGIDDDGYVPREYMTEPTALVEAIINFLEEKRK